MARTLFSVWCLESSQKFLTTNQFLVSTIFFTYEYFFFQCEFYLNHCQRSQSNQEQGSLCCSLPCFHVLLCTQYGPLQCFFGKLKEIGVLRPIFLFTCDYILVLCPTLATLAPLFVHTKIEN